MKITGGVRIVGKGLFPSADAWIIVSVFFYTAAMAGAVAAQGAVAMPGAAAAQGAVAMPGAAAAQGAVAMPGAAAAQGAVAMSGAAATPELRGDTSVHSVDSTSAAGMAASEIRSALTFGALDGYRDRRQTAPQLSGAKRIVPLALAASAVLPGAGQIYNRQTVKAVMMVAVEAALLTGYVVWRQQGLDAEDAYVAYAHAHWNPVRYAEWLSDYVVYLEEEHGATLGAGLIEAPPGVDFSSPTSWTPQERQTVRAFFDEIRTVEGVVYHPETGASFSHKLPYFGEQQYYELIGKYFQFAPGWVDYPAWISNDDFTDAIDPELTGPGGSKPNVQGRFREYARDHADANTLLRRASRTSAVVVLNHVVSAIDAAITAKLHNDRLDTNLELGFDAFNEPLLMASVKWRF